MTTLIGTLSKFSDEIGFNTLLHSGNDVYIIIIVRMIRLLGFGGTSLILALYLKEIGFDERGIGGFMTSVFVGDLISSFLLSVVADQIGRKNVLLLSSVVMTLTGLVFYWSENHYILTIVAVVGILTPSGGEVGPFRSVEQSSIASLAPYDKRSDLYAWYTFLGTFCAALGSFSCGKLIQFCNSKLDFGVKESYHVVFLAYAVLSFLTLIPTILLSNGIEWTTEVAKTDDQNNEDGEQTEQSRLLGNNNSQAQKKADKKFKLLPSFSKDILALVINLSLLFALDSFASSLVPLSWQSYYIDHKFNLPPSYLGSLFFASGIVSGFMSLLGTTLSKRLGPVVTMVVTHLPASILLALIPLPTSLTITIAIIVIRSSTQTMDVAPKHVFLATLVPPETRTAVFGWVNVVKTMAQVIGPTIVGFMTKGGLQWATFVAAGFLKALYDVGMLGTFMAYNRHSEH